MCLIVKRKYRIKNSNIVGHSDIAPLRKKDPGEKFPWNLLNQKGLGIKSKNSNFKSSKLNSKEIRSLFFNNLFKIGYRYINKRKKSKKDVFLVKAFQRRFLPNQVTGVIDQKTLKISHFLANSINN